MTSSIGMIRNPIYIYIYQLIWENKIHGNQTTNQQLLCIIVIIIIIIIIVLIITNMIYYINILITYWFQPLLFNDLRMILQSQSPKLTHWIFCARLAQPEVPQGPSACDARLKASSLGNDFTRGSTIFTWSNHLKSPFNHQQ